MTRKLLLICFLAVVCCTLSARQIEIVGNKLQTAGMKTELGNKTAVMPQTGGMRVSKASSEEDFTYFSSGYFGTVGMGTYSIEGEEYSVAMFVPATYAGMSITTICFILYEDSVLSDVKVWASAELPDSPEEADYYEEATYLYDYDADYYSGQELTTAYTIPSGGCYVGYSFVVDDVSGDAGKFPVVYDYYTTAENSMWLKTDQNSPEWYDYGDSFGASSLLAVIYGEFPDNAAIFSSETFDASTISGFVTTADVDILVTGTNDVTSVSYTVTDVETGTVSDEETLTVSTTSFNSTATLTIEFDSGDVGTAEEKIITLTKVNGEDNEATYNTSVSGYVKTLTESASRKVVEEEFSTTDCGWCPRGITGLSVMSELYPDNFIGISAHAYYVGNWLDPMYCDDYYDVTYTVSGFPSAYLDRGDETDPYYGSGSDPLGIEDDFLEELDVMPDATVEVSANWNSDSTVINVGTEVTFYYTGSADYGIAYVLLGNGLTGSTRYWTQYNYYYYYSDYYADDSYLEEWCNAYYQITGLEYNHVALKAQDIVSGIDGSIPETVTAYEAVSHSTSFDVSDNIPSYTVADTYLLQDKTQVEVVAMLINRITGRIVNADKCSVLAEGLTGITNVNADDDSVTEVGRYTLDGRMLTAPVRGINIVKYSNGKTVKQIVK